MSTSPCLQWTLLIELRLVRSIFQSHLSRTLMSSSHNSSHTTATEPSAEMAAQILRERIGQENVTHTSVLASRRLDEALLRLERASERSRLEPSHPAPTP